MHLAMYKADFLLEVLHHHAPRADAVVYFDPDIVVKCPWPNLEPWLRRSDVAVVEDVNGSLPATAPMRAVWRDYFLKAGLTEIRASDRYYNSGFVSVRREAEAFLLTWRDLCREALRLLGSDTALKAGHGSGLFSTPDQDALNMALMTTDVFVGAADSSAMDFRQAGHYMAHAIGLNKPWRGGAVRLALGGTPPTSAAKQFLTYAGGPIRSFEAAKLRRLRTAQRIGAAMGRFYRRR